eukprot:IDg9572t1
MCVRAARGDPLNFHWLRRPADDVLTSRFLQICSFKLLLLQQARAEICLAVLTAFSSES